MSKLDLPKVTLVCGDGNNREAVEKLFGDIQNRCSFYGTKIFSEGLTSLKAYNLFIAKELVNHVESEFCMVVQLDGFPLHADGWDDRFLQYDYVGAPWFTQPMVLPCRGGNGGFSLRSKRFLEETSNFNYDGEEAEDVFFCREVGHILEKRGIKFAPDYVAARFSCEDMMWNGQFGFHGNKTLAINKFLKVFT
tara:strand:+ start:959 stop:1537 length:579 start_codon:yes stop_codon:yes gene_type:complete